MKNIVIFIFFVSISLAASVEDHCSVWGFFGHRLINRMAVFTLPPELFGFYKKNIDYITEHAIDPDKRRYATKHEAVRHYIDIDHWDKIPFNNVPKDFEEAIIKYCSFKLVQKGDSISCDKIIRQDSFVISFHHQGVQRFTVPYPLFLKYWKKVISPLYYEDDWYLPSYELDQLFNTAFFQKNDLSLYIYDHFSAYGIVPYHIEATLKKLTKAFELKDKSSILRVSAEFGHYISDAHVPLHTTKNYNGQLTDQVGIHAFWESRIPELFAERDYDFFVGKADYIEDPRTFIWDIVIKAHGHLDSVLMVERRLSKHFASDLQFCYDERLGQTIRIQCPEYALAYSNALGNMVETQMRSSIYAVGSLIFTAWVNAGQPDLDQEKMEIPNVPIVQDQNIKVRLHED